ncbi:MAG TPA: hypothetical protein VFM54_02370 [Micromonosporaceae bacterium]|nr:hypothetical protein [Micromonosporaceae bacterium]
MTTSKAFNEDEYRRERAVQGRDDYRQARKQEFAALAEIVSKYARAASSLVFAATAATGTERAELTALADDALQRATRFRVLLAEVELTEDVAAAGDGSRPVAS